MLVSPHVVTPADEREELERIAEWCQRRLTAQADARLLILLPGSAGRRERLATLIQQSFPGHEGLSLVAIEGGQPLASLPMIAHALGSLALLAGEAVGTESFLEWLRAPWWVEPGPAARAGLDLWLREQGRLRLDLNSLLAALRRSPAALEGPAKALGARLESAAGSVRASSGNPRQWSESFEVALEILGWPGARTRDSAGQQTLARFHELLEELGQLSAAAQTLTFDIAVRWLTERAGLTPYRPSDDDATVTISPAYADPVARYDGVWVAGLNAESFPQPVAPDPFLPLAAQVAAGWPAATAAGRLEEARALMTAWRTAAAELVLSTPARAEDIELLPSPLLEEWRTAARRAPKTRRPIWLGCTVAGCSRNGTMMSVSRGTRSSRCLQARAASSCKINVPSALTRSCAWGVRSSASRSRALRRMPADSCCTPPCSSSGFGSGTRGRWPRSARRRSMS